MAEDQGRIIRKKNHGVIIERKYPTEKGHIKYNFNEVRLLPNGWVEGREPKGELDRRDFFPPDEVLNIYVFDEDKPSTSSTW